ncbi:hypothetical protein ACOWNJ_05580 [Helicobacter pylori]
MMGVAEFHFLDANQDKKEALTFRSYNEMIETLTEKIKEANEK